MNQDQRTNKPGATRDSRSPLNDRRVPTNVSAIDGRPVYHIDKPPPSALVIHCADPRFQTAFRRFVNEELGIATYVPVVLGGGIHGLANRTVLPKNFKVLWQQIKFALTVIKVPEVIIINHQDCVWYRTAQTVKPHIDSNTRAHGDLMHTARSLIEDFAGVRIRTFWAELNGDEVKFSEVT
jgi:hypothetical protein